MYILSLDEVNLENKNVENLEIYKNYSIICVTKEIIICEIKYEM